MTPYYRSEDGLVTVYHARWQRLVLEGLVPLDAVRLIHADGPYGVGEVTKRASRSRGTKRRGASAKLNAGNVVARDYAPVVGDDEDFDPAPLLALKRPTVLWGANHYADRVPGSPTWLVWDKRDGIPPNDNADCELAWSNLGGPARLFHHLWNGTCRASETGVPHLGPTQKPILLSAWVFKLAKLKSFDLVFVPFLGTGPDLPAARALGLRVIACDVVEEQCRVAVSRFRAVRAGPGPLEDLGPLFRNREPPKAC